jgi:hypothetical protein
VVAAAVKLLEMVFQAVQAAVVELVIVSTV